MLVYRCIIIAPYMLLGHIQAHTVLQSLIHHMSHMIVSLNIKLMQEIVLVEIHHFLEYLSLIHLFRDRKNYFLVIHDLWLASLNIDVILLLLFY
jgi:hypothetical protein